MGWAPLGPVANEAPGDGSLVALCPSSAAASPGWGCQRDRSRLTPQAQRPGTAVRLQPQPPQTGRDPAADEQDGPAAEQAPFPRPAARHGRKRGSLAGLARTGSVTALTLAWGCFCATPSWAPAWGRWLPAVIAARGTDFLQPEGGRSWFRKPGTEEGSRVLGGVVQRDVAPWHTQRSGDPLPGKSWGWAPILGDSLRVLGSSPFLVKAGGAGWRVAGRLGAAGLKPRRRSGR